MDLQIPSWRPGASARLPGRVWNSCSLIGDGPKWYWDFFGTKAWRKVREILRCTRPKQSNTCFFKNNNSLQGSGERPASLRSKTNWQALHVSISKLDNEPVDSASQHNHSGSYDRDIDEFGLIYEFVTYWDSLRGATPRRCLCICTMMIIAFITWNSNFRLVPLIEGVCRKSL